MDAKHTARAIILASHELDLQVAVQDFARTAAERIRRELVCPCEVFEEQADRKDQLIPPGHQICFWGEAAARLVEFHAGMRGDESCPDCRDISGLCPGGRHGG